MNVLLNHENYRRIAVNTTHPLVKCFDPKCYLAKYISIGSTRTSVPLYFILLPQFECSRKRILHVFEVIETPMYLDAGCMHWSGLVGVYSFG